MAYAFVQQNANDNAATATTITVTLTPSAGNLLVFCVAGDSLDTTSIALSDNLGGGASSNTFTQIGTDLVSVADQRLAWYFAANCKGGATTFTATYSASTRFRTIYVAEYSGIATTSPLLNGTRTEQATPGTGTDAVSSGNANATSQPALVWGFCVNVNGGTTPNAGTGFTSRAGVWSTNTCLGRPEDRRVTATGNVAATFTATTGTDPHATGIGIFAEAASATIDQSAFRFYNDDGSESAMTAAVAESTNLAKPLATNLILRQQLAATGDPASIAYKLRYQKNGSGGYVDVPVGATVPETFGTVTFAAIGTGANGSTTVAPSFPASIAAGDYLTLHVSSGATNSETPTTPSDWTLLATGASTDGSFGVDTGPRRMTVFGKVADGTETGTLTVSITNGDTCRGTIARWTKSSSTTTWVVDGQGANDSGAHTGISMTFGAIDWHTGDATLVATGQRVDTATQSAQSLTASGITFGARTNQAATAVTTGNDHRHTVDTFAAVTAGSGSQAATWSYTASAAASAGGVIVRLREHTAAITNEVFVSTSSNIAASGEATTARLSVPGGKSFTTGRIWDDENGTDSIDIANNNYTELAWCLQAQSPAANGDFYDFRVYAGASPLDSYTVTPRLTVSTGAGVGSAAGTSTATGAGAALSSSGAGTATGTSTASGTGAALAAGAGSSAGTSTAVSSSTIFPLTVSSNGRYLRKNDGSPFLVCADTTWSLFVDLPLSGVSSYFATLVSQGFNSLMGNAIEHHYTTVKPPKNESGVLPFTQRMDGTTYTGSPNGTTGAAGTQGQFASDNYGSPSSQSPDCTFINNSYWTHVETILDAALANNLLVFIWPGYLGFHAGDEGWMLEMTVWDAVIGAGGFTGQSWANATKSKLWNYGAWLANRWKAYPNIIWTMGGDYGTNTQTLSTQERAAVVSLVAGMKSVSGQASTLWTAHWDRPCISDDNLISGVTWDLNFCYADESVAELCRRGYSTAAKPSLLGEYNYENGAFGGSAPWRKYTWWGFLGGIAGGFYGHEQLWRFDDGSPGSDWTTLLSTTARLDVVRQFAFLKARPWHRLVPHGLGGIGTLITAGGGTASPQSTDYVAAAATSEGDLLLAYVPPAHTGSVTIDMTKMATTCVARWFDPTNATYTSIGAFNNSSTHAFTTPGNNAAGDADWLLVLETPTAAAAGTSTVTGVGASLAAGAGTSSGTGTAAAVGGSTAAGAGSAAGTSTAAAVSGVVLSGAGSAAGTSATSGVGAALAAGVGSATGSSTASGGGASLVAGAGASAGISTAVAVGAATAASVGSAAGSGGAAAVGAAIATAAGTAAGAGSAAATGAATSAGTGSTSGTGAASAVGAALDAGTGTASGTSSAAGAGSALAAGAGSAAGTSTAVATGAALAAGAGSAAGSSTAAGVGASAAAGSGTGVAAGTSSAAAVGQSLAAGAGSAAGAGGATAVGQSVAAGTGSSTGASTASGVGTAATAGSGAGLATGGSSAAAVGAALAAGAGTSTGSSAASGAGATSGSTGAASGASTVTGGGASTADGVGISAGSSASLAVSSDVEPGHVRITGVSPDPEVYDYGGDPPPEDTYGFSR